MQEKRLLGRQVPLLPEAFAAIARAEFPEGGVPRRAVSGARARTGGDQPPLHDFLNEAVLEQTLAIGAAEFLGLEDAPSSLLKVPEGCQGRGELFVRCGHRKLLPEGCKSFTLCQYKYIMLYHYKSTMLC